MAEITDEMVRTFDVVASCYDEGLVPSYPAIRAALSAVAPLIANAQIEACAEVKALDLSNLLKHAFSAGYMAAAGDGGWSDYDPTECSAYARIEAAIRALKEK